MKYQQMCSSWTSMLIFKVHKSGNADFYEQRRKEAFPDLWALENHSADENKHLLIFIAILPKHYTKGDNYARFS